MLKNISQYIRHNLKSGKSILLLMSVVMIICGPVPAFLTMSDRIQRISMLKGLEKTNYARSIERFLLRLFDISGESYYHIMLSLIAAVAGLVLAFVLFYYFRRKESSDFFLSLPVTRTEAYIANFASGVLYYIIPLIITSAITMIGLSVMGAWNYVNIFKLIFNNSDYTGILAMLGTNILYFLLFFALGTIAVLLSSNGINALVVYGTINFYPIVFMFLLISAADIFNNDIVDFRETILEGCLYITPILRPLLFMEYAPTLWTFILLPIFAAVFGLLGCFLCNKRPAESWSSAIIYAPVRLILQYMYCFIVAFAAGLFFYSVTDRSIANIIVGAIFGLVLSFMILNIIFERDVKAIFKKPLRLVWSALIFTAVFLLIVMDVFGIFRYRQPAFSSIDYVNVSLNQNVVNSYYPYQLKEDYGTSKIDEPEAKEAAIKLYTLLHEEVRNNNYRYHFRDNTPNTASDKYFDKILRSRMSNVYLENSMFRNGKEIRPLRENYFERKEEFYDLFKAIYDSEQYTDSLIPLFTYADFKAAKVTTKTINAYGSGTGFFIDDSSKLREALLADLAELDFDGLQNTSPYVVNIYYSMIPGKYKDISERVMVTQEYVDDSYLEIEAERTITVIIPECFTRTIALIEEDTEMLERFDMLHNEIYEKISVIYVETFDRESGELNETITVTDKAEIERIMNDMYYSAGRNINFPKYGVLLNVYYQYDDSKHSGIDSKYYTEDTYSYDDIKVTAVERDRHTMEFLERFSTLY